MPELKAIKGFADLFAEDSRLFAFLESQAREVFFRYGYGELRTPVMEFTDLFVRGIGTETDVVQKEMYSLSDSKGRSMSLRPEATAGVMRAYIEHNVQAQSQVSKFFTTGPMFRHERPQKGRLRQFHQINAECLGPDQPEADAELICMLMDYLGSVGIKDISLQINSLGCATCRQAYRSKLRSWLDGLDPSALCGDCQRRKETNPLRVLDCKVPTCQEHSAAAPVLLDNICPECRAHFDTVSSLLQSRNVPYVLNHRLVRGLDYYTRTTFEVVSNNIGAQGSIAGGGRYDGLVSSLGGPEVPGLGFACGMERLAMLLGSVEGKAPDFFVAALENSGQAAAFNITQALRAAGLSGTQAFECRSLKSVMRQAGKSGARFTLILGPDEVAQGQVTIKRMSDGSQTSLAQDGAAAFILADQTS